MMLPVSEARRHWDASPDQVGYSGSQSSGEPWKDMYRDPGCSKRNEFGINSFFVTEDKISTGVYNLMNNSRNY